MKYKILGSPSVPDMPWQEKPADCGDIPIWRYTENPIIDRNPIPGVARIFNSAVAPYEDGYIGVFRAEQTDGIPFIYLGRSKDGIHWSFEKEKICFQDEQGNEFMPLYAYDPRLVRIDGIYYLIWCQDAYGAAIGMARIRRYLHFREPGSGLLGPPSPCYGQEPGVVGVCQNRRRSRPHRDL